MNIKETVRYATLGAAAALLVSGGIYAGSAFQAQQLNSPASDGYSGNFDYVQKQATGGAHQAHDAADAPVPEATEDGHEAQRGDTQPAPDTNAPAPAASSGTPAASANQPSAQSEDPPTATDPTVEPADSEPAPADEPEAETEEPAAEPDPGDEPETPAAGEPAVDPEPEPGEDPEEPGGGGVPLGPSIFKAIDPCLLVKCDPVPPPDKLALDPCLINDCVEVEGGPVVVPPVFVPGLPPPVFQFR